jgi:23S rRNA pseudouridine2605 synthase
MNTPSELRINHFLARAGICSRRKADELIVAQRVRLNGVTAKPGDRVAASDEVLLDNKTVPWPGVGNAEYAAPSGEKFTYILLNKPIQVVSTVRDPEGRTTVLDLLPEDLQRLRLFPVGRLDYFSQGLLILTNDGDLTYRLTHPKWHMPKVYHVLIRGQVTETAIQTLRGGMTLAEGENLAPIDCRILRVTSKNDTWLEMILHQGINRQIRRMLRDLHLTILVLTRIKQGPLELGDIKNGQWRHLSVAEVAALKK